ncbi:MAG: RNA 2',3'-cyclic phosphodiesterase [Desulfobacterales bacterium]|nr:RNA 2',3'-cyclic phosphodiesterase [Desulfobacterales bacterium]
MVKHEINSSGNDNELRLFIAMVLPESIIAEIADIQRQLKRYHHDIRWVQPKNIHLTIKFLGDVNVSKVDSIIDAIKCSVGYMSPIQIQAKGIGMFPGLKNPKVLWIGLSGDIIQLKQYHNRLEDLLVPLGFAKEDRPFKAHLTIGRIKNKMPINQAQDILRQFETYTSPLFLFDRIVLFKSDLRPEGPLYKPMDVATIASIEHDDLENERKR